MITALQVTCTPTETRLVPHSTGHLLYAGMLDAVRRHDSDLSSRLHSEERSRLTVSPLKGEFDAEDRNRKRVFDDAEYRFTLTLLEADDAFPPLFNDLVLQGESLALGDATFELRSLESEEHAFDDFMTAETPQELRFHFTSPASIDYHGSGVTEMFPHREAVFAAIHHSWNRHAPDEYAFDLDPQDVKNHVMERPDAGTYRTHNTIVTRKERDDGNGTYPIKAFGFTGKTTYTFRDAPDKLKHKLAILTRWAHHAGIGSHTARGCGATNTEVVVDE